MFLVSVAYSFVVHQLHLQKRNIFSRDIFHHVFMLHPGLILSGSCLSTSLGVFFQLCDKESQDSIHIRDCKVTASA